MNFKLSKIGVTIAAVTLSVLFSACSSSDDPSREIEKAQAFVEEGEFASAEIELRNALGKEPQNVEALGVLGRIYYEQGRVRDAYKVLSAVRQIGPAGVDSLAMLANIQISAGMHEQARENSSEALQIDPSNTMAYMALAESVQDQESADDAREMLDGLPESAIKKAALGAIALKTNDVTTAESLFLGALEMDSNLAAAHLGMFAIHAGSNQPELAEQSITRAAESSDTRSPIKVHYANFLAQNAGNDEAIEYLNSIVDSAPDYLPAISLLADLSAKAGDTNNAKEYVERALKLDALDLRAMRLKGAISLSEEKNKEAINQLNQLLKLYPQDIQSHYQIALAFIREGQSEEAKKSLATVVEAIPTHFEATALLANLMTQEKDFTGAILTLERFLENSPQSTEGKLLLAGVNNQKGDNQAAIKIYQELEKEFPKDPAIDYLSGVSYLNERESKKARAAFESVLEKEPTHLHSIEFLTAIDLKENNSTEALERVDRAITTSPDVSELHSIRARILQDSGNLDTARASFEEAIQLDPKNESARLNLAQLLLQQEENLAARELLEKIIEINPKSIPSHYLLANLYEKSEEYAKAVERYESVLAIDPNHLQSLNNLSYIYSSRKENLQKAFELAERARKIAPTNPFIADTLGWIVYKRGDYQWARSLLEESIAKLSNNNEVAYHIGSTYYALGIKEKAIDFLTIATSTQESYAGLNIAEEKLKLLSTEPASNEAESIIRDLLNRDENDTFALSYMAERNRVRGLLDEAEQFYREALEASPAHLSALIGISKTLAESQEYESAREFANLAAKNSANNTEVLSIQGNIAYELGDYEWALNRFTQINRTAQPDPLIQRNIALSLFALGRLEELAMHLKDFSRLLDSSFSGWDVAIQFINDRRKEKPTTDASGVMSSLAQGYYQLSTANLPDAKSTFEEILKIFPDQIQAKLGVAEILIKEPSSTDNAALVISGVREKVPSNVHAKALEALYLQQKGKTSQALRLAQSIPVQSSEKLGPYLDSQLSALREGK